jgi:arginase family enzyme
MVVGCDVADARPRAAASAVERASAIQRARARMADTAAGAPAVTMIGSGDFHHLAVLLLERAREPVTVIHFDNHPDWVRWAPRWHCGSW